MCLESFDPATGKSHIVSDDSPESLKQLISNLSAENAVLKARNEQLEEQKKTKDRALMQAYADIDKVNRELEEARKVQDRHL